MKKATLLVALLVGVTGMAQADGYLHGQPGTSYNNIGGTTFGSDGTSYNRIGNTTFGSDGSSSNRIGNGYV